MLNESLEGDINVLRRRPERITLILDRRHSEQMEEDLRFSQGPDKSLVIDHIAADSSLDVHSPTLKPFFEEYDARCNLLQVGDVVENISGLDCREISVVQAMEYWHRMSGPVSITVRTHEGAIHEGLCQLVLLKTTPSEEGESPCFPNTGLSFAKRQGLLQVQGFSSKSLLAGTPLDWGDVCIAMATTLCASLDAKDAQSLWQMQTETSRDCLSLLTIRATEAQKRWGRVRRTAVAVGGGTLLGVGGVLMVTPLHPIGHAMTIGGVGVLGTEFEGPKRAIQAAKDKFKRRESPPPPPM